MNFNVISEKQVLAILKEIGDNYEESKKTVTDPDESTEAFNEGYEMGLNDIEFKIREYFSS
ncbi:MULTISPECIES: hypothetical protein [Pseudoalteromonas]|uniref:hypothetical protein n=1 Tax=Pseudoalteromonas TaxID=53246 RepID=UPI001581CD1F|nr:MULTISPECIES: hypothetical protein [Pseudoalteromonas]MDI4654508.1 hypothetical protein [Pseudoalteromonas shioyasakiensis]NUJ39391.1 hypothetical protein [Pseudoalteromonas sp. 0303]